MSSSPKPVWNTRPGTPGPRSALEVEAQAQAVRKIETRLKLAKVFHRYRACKCNSTNGISVTSNPRSIDETISLNLYENKTTVQVTVKNSGASGIYFSFMAFDFVVNFFTVTDKHGNVIKNIKEQLLGAGESYEMTVNFAATQAGFYEQLLIFQFGPQHQTDKFKIMRLLEVMHRTSRGQELVYRTSKASIDDCPISGGFETACFIPVVPLKKYGMPQNIIAIWKANKDALKPLNWKHYCPKFHLLLHLEEYHQNAQLKKYNQSNVAMFKHKAGIYFLQIAGLCEGAEQTLDGRMVLVAFLEEKHCFKSSYKGCVRHVATEKVFIVFKDMPEECYTEGMRVKAFFFQNRMPLRMQHRAVSLAQETNLMDVLFPTGEMFQTHSLPSLLEHRTNPEQHTAIQHIVGAFAKPAPYLVFGPPGTGKTVTLVEAISQILKTQHKPKILACAASNSATDHLCQKIVDAVKFGVYRLYSLNFNAENILHHEKLCTNYNIRSKSFTLPSINCMMSFNVLCTTLQTAGRLVSRGICPGFYTYIFVDEAGQATEPETIVALAGLVDPHVCQVVLAGDPKQLGPIITSAMAWEHGLGVPLLERLMTDCELYQDHEGHGYDNCFVTKLLRNYRSHPAILKIPNELFYKGKLQYYAPKDKCCAFCSWELLPKKGFPVIFHGVAGRDQRDSNSPSLYNMAEVDVVKEYLKALVHHFHKKGKTKIQEKEIGIITPYRKQLEKIQRAFRTDRILENEDLENVLVGTVERFQGKEFDVILISTVRSTIKLTASEQNFTLGFVGNEKRFNVAMTRARALTIVIGDPRSLKTDPIWNKFIAYCHKEGSYRGITVSDTAEEEDTEM